MTKKSITLDVWLRDHTWRGASAGYVALKFCLTISMLTRKMLMLEMCKKRVKSSFWFVRDLDREIVSFTSFSFRKEKRKVATNIMPTGLKEDSQTLLKLP